MATPRAADELVELAAIIRAHGLGGMLLLKPFNPDSALLYELKQVILRSPDRTHRTVNVLAAREHSGQILCSLEGVVGRDAAEALKGSTICVTRADLPEPEEGEHYLMDLVGLTVQDEAGATVGTVEEVIEYPSTVCLKVVSADTIWEVPHLERYFVSVDFDTRVIHVTHLDELDLMRTEKAKR